VGKEFFLDKLRRRCAQSDVEWPRMATAARLGQYFDLLAKWNARINLTSLALSPLSDEAVDRLFIEPLAAAPHLPAKSANWFDLGSGGGSPALPLRIAWDQGALTMIEAKTRKTAFLREAVRALELPHVFVENARFEDVAEARQGQGQLVTVRAVRADAALASTAARLLGFEGRLLLFGSASIGPRFREFDLLETVPLIKGRASFLSVYRRVVPRGTTHTR
jgi:16S rRNA (guanine(527)-N(7))-methyltransferase RsmG